MPWKAQLDGKVINLYSALIAKTDLSDWPHDGYKCLGCGSDMTLVAVGSKFVSPHFRHVRDSDCFSGGKSKEHDQAQTDLYNLLADEYPHCEIDIEHYIPPLENEKKRYVDVAVLKDGKRFEAHEIQLSKQSVDIFAERTFRYFDMGFEVVCWWIQNGGHNDHPNIKNFLIKTCGCYGTLALIPESELLRERVDEHRPAFVQVG